MILMEDWGLSSSPLSVCIWKRWVLWENLSDVPEEEIWVVDQCLGVEGVVIEEDRSSSAHNTSSQSLGHEVYDVEVSNPASDVEVLDWKLSDSEKS